MYDKHFHKHTHHHNPPPIDLSEIRRVILEMNERTKRIMTAQTDLDAGFTSLAQTLGEVATELGELGVALDNAVAASDMSVVQAVTARMKLAQTKLADAANAVDITKDTPVSGGTPVVVPPTPLDATYPDVATFTTAATAYRGLEEVDLVALDATSSVVHPGTTPALVFTVQADGSVVKQ